MILAYSLRLVCLLVVVAGLVNAALQILLRVCAPILLRRLDAASPRARERALYLLQIAPALLAAFVAGALCLPEYLLPEPAGQVEPVGCITLLLLAAVAAWFGFSLFRGLRIALRTLTCSRHCRQTGIAAARAGKLPVIALHQASPPLAVLGFVRPIIVIAAELLEAAGLHPAALNVALDHERAHVRHFDNWKLLSLCFLPRVGASVWLRPWQFAADCAADQDAVRNDPERSLLLAEALVHAARRAGAASPSIVCTALISADAALADRVDRLLRPRPVSRSMANPFVSALAGLALLAVTAVSLATPWLYSVSERILHLGGF